jgi:AcrR family transcriptional regulator
MRTREKQSNEVKNKIIDVARNLMVTQGYKKTTTRQIIEKAEVTNGTLYHFFRDKEDLLRAVAKESFNNINQAIDTLSDVKVAPILRYVFGRVLEIKAAAKYRNVAEMYVEVYSSYFKQGGMPIRIAGKKTLFHKYNKDLSDQNYYVRTIALIGIRWSFFNECACNGGGNFEAIWPVLVEAELTLFNVPDSVIKNTIEKTAKWINEESVKILEFTI